MISLIRRRTNMSPTAQTPSEIRIRPPGMSTSTPCDSGLDTTVPLAVESAPQDDDGPYFDLDDYNQPVPALDDDFPDEFLLAEELPPSQPSTAPTLEDIGPENETPLANQTPNTAQTRIKMPKTPKPMKNEQSLSDMVRQPVKSRKSALNQSSETIQSRSDSHVASPQLSSVPVHEAQPAYRPKTPDSVSNFNTPAKPCASPYPEYVTPRTNVVRYPSDVDFADIPQRRRQTSWRQQPAPRPLNRPVTSFYDPYEFEEDDYYMPPSQLKRNIQTEILRPVTKTPPSPRKTSPREYNKSRSSSPERNRSRSTSPHIRKEVRITSPTLSKSDNNLSNSRENSPKLDRKTITAATKAPKFYGKDWPTYILRFEAYAGLHGWDDEEKAHILPTCLEGDTVLAMQSRSSRTWTYNRIVQELEIRYGRKIDEDELERQIREAQQGPNMPYSTFYDQIYALALKLKRSEQATDEITLRAFKAGVREPGLRSYLVKEKPKDIAAAYQAISEWEAMARAAQPLVPPRVNTVNMPECNMTGLDLSVAHEETPLPELVKQLSMQVGEATETTRKQQDEIRTLKSQLQERSQNFNNSRSSWRNNGRGYRSRGRNYNNRGSRRYNDCDNFSQCNNQSGGNGARQNYPQGYQQDGVYYAHQNSGYNAPNNTPNYQNSPQNNGYYSNPSNGFGQQNFNQGPNLNQSPQVFPGSMQNQTPYSPVEQFQTLEQGFQQSQNFQTVSENVNVNQNKNNSYEYAPSPPTLHSSQSPGVSHVQALPQTQAPIQPSIVQSPGPDVRQTNASRPHSPKQA